MDYSNDTLKQWAEKGLYEQLDNAATGRLDLHQLRFDARVNAVFHRMGEAMITLRGVATHIAPENVVSAVRFAEKAFEDLESFTGSKSDVPVGALHEVCRAAHLIETAYETAVQRELQKAQKLAAQRKFEQAKSCMQLADRYMKEGNLLD